MALRTIGGYDETSALVIAKSLTPGDTFQGVYLASKKGKFGGEIYEVKLTKAATVVFTDKETNEVKSKTIPVGGTAAIAGSGGLNWSMSQVKPGETVIITYQGKQVMKAGPFAGKEAHNWSVQVEVPEPTFASASASRAPEIPFD